MRDQRVISSHHGDFPEVSSAQTLFPTPIIFLPALLFPSPLPVHGAMRLLHIFERKQFPSKKEGKQIRSSVNSARKKSSLPRRNPFHCFPGNWWPFLLSTRLRNGTAPLYSCRSIYPQLHVFQGEVHFLRVRFNAKAVGCACVGSSFRAAYRCMSGPLALPPWAFRRIKIITGQDSLIPSGCKKNTRKLYSLF